GAAQTHHAGFVMALRAQPDQVCLGGHFDKAPFFGIETAFDVDVHDAVAHVADLGHPAHRFSCTQIGSAVAANISAVAFALSTGGPLPSWPMQMARLARTM